MLEIEVEGTNQLEIFEKLAEAQEVYGEQVCGKCKNPNVMFRVRSVDDNKFYEIQCCDIKCRHKLSFGQHKKSKTLFPRRKDDENQFLPNNGWHVYVPEAKAATPAAKK